MTKQTEVRIHFRGEKPTQEDVLFVGNKTQAVKYLRQWLKDHASSKHVYSKVFGYVGKYSRVYIVTS